MQGTRWTFTLNNYTDAAVANIDNWFSTTPNIKYAVYGFERGESGTPHLQGFFVTRTAVRFNAIRRNLPGAHIERARSTSQVNADYCKKDGDFREFGVFPGNAGQRNDLLAVREWGEQFIAEHGRAPSRRECFRDQWSATHKYPHLVEGFEALAPHPVIQEGELRDWQAELEEELLKEADDRTVTFYVDDEGNKGKSWFIRYMISKYPEDVQVMAPGKLQDMAYAVDTNKRIYLFNVARGQMEYLQYSILESLKDRMVLSTKYRPCTKLLRYKCHVVVMCNEEPDRTKMSRDRYDCRAI